MIKKGEGRKERKEGVRERGKRKSMCVYTKTAVHTHYPLREKLEAGRFRLIRALHNGRTH